MNERKLIKFVFLLIIIFIIHISLYYLSNDYKNIIISIKYSNNPVKEVVNTGSISNTGNIIKGVSNYTGSNFQDEEDILNTPKIDEQKKDEINVSNDKVIFTGGIESENNSKDEEYVLNLFKSFKLEKLKSHSSLFDLTTEYPDPYLEYYSSNNELTLYIFKLKLYDDVLNIFDVISYNLPFKIKKVNNFGDASFFINMDKSLEDEYIRFIFSYKNNVFGLKIKKDSYNEIKEILNKLK